MRVLSVDPGGTSATSRGSNPQGVDGATGAVVFEPISQFEIKVIEWRETVERMTFLNWAWNQKQFQGVDYCICEAYKPASFVKTYQPDVIYIIGTLEWMWTPDLFYNRTFASAAKTWGTDTKIAPYRRGENAVGRGGAGHALMALRHALHWTANVWEGRNR